MRFQTLYDGKRMRYDDAVKQIAQEFFLKETTVERIINKKI